MTQAMVVDTPDDPREWMDDHVDTGRESGAISGNGSEAGRSGAARTASEDSTRGSLATTDATAAKKVGEITVQRLRAGMVQ